MPINGETWLRAYYPGLEEKQYQPAGIDLTLGSINFFEKTENTICGLCKDTKILPNQIELPTHTMHIDGSLRKVYFLKPKQPYIAVTKEKINIDYHSGQLYLPRSSLLRAGVDVRTAFGDPGFNGHLSFLIINHRNDDFMIEQGTRFAQLINIDVDGIVTAYDGDYNEK